MKLRRSKITLDEIVRLYTVELLTVREIGEVAGVSGAAISNALKAAGVEYTGGRITKQCVYCGGEFEVRRKSVKNGKGLYCSLRCCGADRSLGGDMSISSRLGRAAVLLHIKTPLKPGQVVHHIDGDRTNNNLDNLMIFDSQIEHMQYHHSLRKSGAPIGKPRK